eukprot:c21357_g1_i3 orf=358-780(-)
MEFFSALMSSFLLSPTNDDSNEQWQQRHILGVYHDICGCWASFCCPCCTVGEIDMNIEENGGVAIQKRAAETAQAFEDHDSKPAGGPAVPLLLHRSAPRRIKVPSKSPRNPKSSASKQFTNNNDSTNKHSAGDEFRGPYR